MECRRLMKRKNILFIMADQMAAPMLPFYGPSPIKLPNLSRLAAEGVVFDAAYCNSPLCAPSRFTLVSGQLPGKIGAYDNAADFPADVPTYAHYLRRLGYRTALSGKMHFCGPDQLHGYEERLTSDISPADYGWAVNWDEPDVRPTWYHNMSSVLQAGPCVRTNQLDFDEEVVFKAQQYLFDHIREDGDQPFCLTVSMTHPHDPYTIPKPFWDLYDDSDIPLPTTPAQGDLDPHSQRLLKVYDLWDKPLPPEKIRDARRAYFGACSYIDSNVGKLLQTLDDTGLADDTIIIFSGDHGDMLGERGLWYKMHWFELAGGELEPHLPLDGRSLVPHLQGQGGHDEVFGEYMAEGTVSPLMMIRRGAYKFIYSEDDPCLLFDVHNDPREQEELSQSPQHRALFAAFLTEARAKWDIPAIHQQVLASQRRRRLVFEALTQGKLKSWDHQPRVDASQQYMRNHIDLDDLERKARYPQPCQHP